MEGISRKLVAELRGAWAAKRGKGLDVPEALVAYVAGQAHALNERSKGKEGGRVVRKLISEWVEAPLQREISLRPAEYRACSGVSLEFEPPGGVPPDGPPPAPAVSVRFNAE
jgi:hypothetical protein